MSGPWQSAPNYDADTAPCQRCGKDVNLDHDPPCPHSICICDTCNPVEVCPDCRETARADMFRTGHYSEALDPLTQTPVETREEYLARTRLPGFDPKTNSYRRTP